MHIMRPNRTLRFLSIQRAALSFLVLLTTGCTTVELTHHRVDSDAGGSYRNILLKVELSDTEERTRLIRQVMREFERYRLQYSVVKSGDGEMARQGADYALLKIAELERRIETIDYHQTYGRTSLTQNRGRRKADVPVITLRVTLTDSTSEQKVFLADYVTRGPWHADSAAVVASAGGALVRQLEHDGFIAAK